MVYVKYRVIYKLCKIYKINILQRKGVHKVNREEMCKWCSIPAEELEKLEEDRRNGRAPGPARPRGTAGNEMCTFLIINISSLQLIPVNVIAYRSQYGSAAPASIVGAGILATAVSTAAAVIFCKAADRS